jgi:hypothetical protein
VQVAVACVGVALDECSWHPPREAGKNRRHPKRGLVDGIQAKKVTGTSQSMCMDPVKL